MSHPMYKLTYFPLRGRGEVARQLFHLAGVPFEDHRVPLSEWAAYKSKTPFGHVPVLNVNGEELAQSFAIDRYLAKQFGFAGATPFEAAWVDAVADLQADYFVEILHALHIVTDIHKGDKEKEIREVLVPARDKLFPLLEKVVKENGSTGHFVGSYLTWVDLLIADHVGVLLENIPGFLDAYPTVLTTVKNIVATPKLKEFIEKRPVMKF